MREPVKRVWGAGSNVVDLFFTTNQFPQSGAKHFITDGTKRVVGGVTLNHLAWARTLGVPAGLFCVHGASDTLQPDPLSEIIKKKLLELDLAADIKLVSTHETSISYIIRSPDGERTILMSKGGTELMTGEFVEKNFGYLFNPSENASMFSTEISQLPLSGARYILESSRQRGILGCIDVDIPPSVATGSANLGTQDDLIAALKCAGVIKLTVSAAEELLKAVSSETTVGKSLTEIAELLANAYGVPLVSITDGSRGAAFAISKQYLQTMNGGSSISFLSKPYPGITQVDTTGAGDAFFGGMIADIYHHGLPKSLADLERLGNTASAAGAACVEVLGALPTPNSKDRLIELNPSLSKLIKEARPTLGSPVASNSPDVDFVAKSPKASAWINSLTSDAETASSIVRVYSEDMELQDRMSRLVKELVKTCSKRGLGHVLTSGMGKSGAVASRLAISLRSVGLRASFVHASEWVHGDLGTAGTNDVVIMISQSGRTDELLVACQILTDRGVKVMSITGNDDNPLALSSEINLPSPARKELLDTVPSASIIAQDMVCNAIVGAVIESLGVTQDLFRVNHPGGAIGLKKK